ncbi:MAG TPA: gephyrin-like molybdotransferase Glp [Pseudomonadales bacterium]|nr:gephyrin-like molybdotransferase Glp [Pseudomonadales bacterium]
MLTIREARETILAAAKPLHKTDIVSLLESSGRVLAQNVIAAINVPSCDNSAMDGYAVRAEDCVAGQPVPVAGIIYAGAVPGMLQAGTAQRIFTGAPVPQGADAVVIQEDVTRDDNVITIHDGVTVKIGENIRRAGEDIAVGDVLFSTGHRLRAQDIGLLASIGVDQFAVTSALRVGLLCTGDELLEPGEQAQTGKIYNSNRYLLSALLRDLGCEVIDAGIVQDDLAATEAALQKLSTTADVVISTGGVSVGDADYVKQAVLSQGKLDVWKIAVKPGKPLAFGSVATVPFFGLPGNPVSAFITFLLFVRPFLQTLQGAVVQELRHIPARAGFDWPRAIKREEYLRVTLQQEGEVLIARALPNQGSGVLSSVCQADALLCVPVGETFAAGDSVNCLLLL